MIRFTKCPSSVTTSQLRDDSVIRVTDMGFDESVLLDQDRFLTAVLQRPEFQTKMTGTELRYRLGAFYAEQELRSGVQPGLSHLHPHRIPIFVGAPADGSVFLNSMKLWAMKQAGLIPDYAFELDMHAEVFEACAIITGACSRAMRRPSRP